MGRYEVKMKSIRSLIFVPGNRVNMLEKALTFDADIIMVDLEDSVPTAQKLSAIPIAQEWANKLTQAGKTVMIRLNALDTGLTKNEITHMASNSILGFSVGKISSANDVKTIDIMLSEIENKKNLPSRSLKFIAWIESAKAIMNLQEISTASTRTIALAFGAEDLTNDMEITRTELGAEIAVPRAMVPIAAKAVNLPALDSPFVSFNDYDALTNDATNAKSIGYTGKFAIHPNQIETINKIFSPSVQEIEYAQKVMTAWEQAESQGEGSIALDGKMIDVPVVKRAQNVLISAGLLEDKFTL